MSSRTDPEVVRAALREYLNVLARPTIASLAGKYGVSRPTMTSWVNRNTRLSRKVYAEIRAEQDRVALARALLLAAESGGLAVNRETGAIGLTPGLASMEHGD